MDQPTFFLTILGILFGISFIIAILVAIAGCVCLRPEEMMTKVFPYIKKSGNHNVIYGYIIGKKSIKYLYFQLTLVVALTLADILCNTIVSISFKYNPYDGLDCYGYCKNGSTIRVTSEEQAENVKVMSLVCVGWNFDIAGAIGHTVALLTLLWILIYIVLWIKIKWWDKIINCRQNREVLLSGCCYLALLLFQVFLLLCLLAMHVGVLTYMALNSSFYELTQEDRLDVLLIFIVLNSGMGIFPTSKKSKFLADYCKEAVENNQGEEERALVPIKNRLRERRVQDHRIEIDLLLELAEQECKKTLANMYHYGTDDHRNTINEDEIKTIAQVAYRKVTTNDGGGQYNNGQQYNTREGRASINVPTERDRLLGNTRRNNNNYSHFN